MKYFIVLIIFLFLTSTVYAISHKYFDNRRKRCWFNFIAFDTLFALATLAVYYMAGAIWYVILLIIVLNIICIYISGWYLFTRIIFSRRNNNYEQL
jgi:hypothetical protein